MARLLPLSRRPGGPVLVCLPHAGGWPWFFQPWADQLDDVEVWVVDLHSDAGGAGTRPSSLTASAADLRSEVATRSDGRPVALFGHSMGAALAYEMCRPSSAGWAPVLLSVSGCLPPQRWQGSGAGDTAGPQLSDSALRRRLDDWDGTPAEVLADDDLMGVLLPRLRRDLTLCRTYRPRTRTRVDVPISAHAGTTDSEAPPPLVAGWSETTSRWQGLRTWAGGHFFHQRHQRSLTGGIQDEILAAVAAQDLR